MSTARDMSTSLIDEELFNDLFRIEDEAERYRVVLNSPAKNWFTLKAILGFFEGNDEKIKALILANKEKIVDNQLGTFIKLISEKERLDFDFLRGLKDRINATNL